MKRVVSVLINLVMLSVIQPAFASDNVSYAEAEALTLQEAATLAYLWEVEKYVRDVYITGTGCSDNPEAASAAITEQEHMDLLKGLLSHYGLDVPVPSEEPGVFTESYLSTLNIEQLVWTGYGYACVNPPAGLFFNAIVYEEFAIWNLLQAIEQTDKQRLLYAYNHILVEACDHLQSFASLHQAGWDTPLFLSQDELDAIMAGTFVTPSDEEFAINAGLNDAWYYPETDGQGFFITVFPDRGTVSLAWFTFDTVLPNANAFAYLGDPGQRWLIAHGPFEGAKATLTVKSVSGGLFDTSPPEPVREVIGTIILQFEDCNAGSVIYDLPTISQSGVIPIERVAGVNIAACEGHQ